MRKHIVICGRMAHEGIMREISSVLDRAGFRITIPQGARRPAVRARDRRDEFRHYFGEIACADAILVLTLCKGDMPGGYIGGNTLLEMGFAHVLNKPIILLDAPNSGLPYLDEITRMRPIVMTNLSTTRSLANRLKTVLLSVGSWQTQDPCFHDMLQRLKGKIALPLTSTGGAA